MAEKKKKIPRPSPFLYWIYALIFLGLFGLMYLGDGGTGKEITWQQFEKEILGTGDVERIVVVNREMAEVYIAKEKLEKQKYQDVSNEPLIGSQASSGPHFYFTIGSVETFENKLDQAAKENPAISDIPIKYTVEHDLMSYILPWLIPIGIFVLIWMFFLRGASRAGSKHPMFTFGRSKATLFDKGKTKVTFKDVAGLEEAKAEVKELVEFLKSPGKYTKLGAKIPKGVMLVGPPGTGKTLMAKAVAGEAGVPFFSLSGSDFVEMFVGVGASRVRDLFKQAKEKSPCIIFIDEIDAIGRSRGKVQSFQSNDERENTLNQLLSEMDGFETNSGVIVLAATNRGDVLDPALLRPGRFDRHIYLELPNKSERKAIFTVHVNPIKVNEDIDLESLAAQTPGFSGADIANVCNEAALIAAREGKSTVEMHDFHEAMDRVVAGLEKKSKVISDKEKKVIAFHESGHAVTSWLLKNVDPLVKLSIIPRGKSLGAAWYLPDEHQLMTYSEFFDKICAALGGRVAEEITFGEVSSGALDDLEKVTKQAYAMVTTYGFDEKIGNISFYDSSGNRDNSFQKPYSEETAKIIDEEVRKLVERAYKRTKTILTENENLLNSLATSLLKKEVLYKEDLEEILGKRNFNKQDDTEEILKSLSGNGQAAHSKDNKNEH